MDELTIITVQGERRYLWRAVDQDDNLIDILIQKRTDRQAAKRVLRKMWKGQGRSPRRSITDKRKSYGAARRGTMPLVVHSDERRANNRAQASHQQTRDQERKMRRFNPSVKRNDSYRYVAKFTICFGLGVTYGTCGITVGFVRSRFQCGGQRRSLLEKSEVGQIRYPALDNLTKTPRKKYRNLEVDQSTKVYK